MKGLTPMNQRNGTYICTTVYPLNEHWAVKSHAVVSNTIDHVEYIFSDGVEMGVSRILGSCIRLRLKQVPLKRRSFGNDASGIDEESAVELDASLSPRPDNDDDDHDDLDLRALGDNCVSVREWTRAAQLICDDRVVRCREGWIVMLAVNGIAVRLMRST